MKEARKDECIKMREKDQGDWKDESRYKHDEKKEDKKRMRTGLEGRKEGKSENSIIARKH